MIIQLFALNFACLSSITDALFEATTPSHRTQYLLQRYANERDKRCKRPGIVSYVIKPQLCDEQVLGRVLALPWDAVPADINSPGIERNSSILLRAPRQLSKYH